MKNDQPQPEVELTPSEARMQNLKILVINLRSVKRQEESIKTNRIAIEETIAALVPGKEVGQMTETLLDGSKVVITRGLNYKADLPAVAAVLIQNADDKLPVPIESRTTRILDIYGYEWYKVHHPNIFQKIAEHVTVTPKKVSVVLKPAKDK